MKKELGNLDLYNEVKKLVKRANQRLVRMERNFGVDTWGSKKLRDELDTEPLKAWTSSHRIRINKSMDEIQLNAIKKSTSYFLDHPSYSTVKGIKQVIKKQKAGLKRSLSSPDPNEPDISDEDVETLYEFFGESYAPDIISKIPSSDLVSLMIEAKKVRQYRRRKYFFEQINDYINYGNDIDLKRKLGKLYRKYVKE